MFDDLNLVLVGMPGCGKSRIGKLVAGLLGREFVDLDELVVRSAGMSIPEIFEKFGEPGFRTMERAAAEQAAALRGAVISTGGGTIIQQGAPELFRKTGCVCYLRRPVEKLQTAHGRPLSTDRDAVKKLYAARREKYESGSDFQVDNTESAPQDTARKVVAAFAEFAKKRQLPSA